MWPVSVYTKVVQERWEGRQLAMGRRLMRMAGGRRDARPTDLCDQQDGPSRPVITRLSRNSLPSAGKGVHGSYQALGRSLGRVVAGIGGPQRALWLSVLPSSLKTAILGCAASAAGFHLHHAMPCKGLITLVRWLQPTAKLLVSTLQLAHAGCMMQRPRPRHHHGFPTFTPLTP